MTLGVLVCILNKITSPLRYPGSKATFLNVVLQFIEVHGLKGREIVEPYAGEQVVAEFLSRKAHPSKDGLFVFCHFYLSVPKVL